MGNAKDWNTGAELIANHIIENHPEFKVSQRPGFRRARLTPSVDGELVPHATYLGFEENVLWVVDPCVSVS